MSHVVLGCMTVHRHLRRDVLRRVIPAIEKDAKDTMYKDESREQRKID